MVHEECLDFSHSQKVAQKQTLFVKKRPQVCIKAGVKMSCRRPRACRSLGWVRNTAEGENYPLGGQAVCREAPHRLQDLACRTRDAIFQRSGRRFLIDFSTRPLCAAQDKGGNQGTQSLLWGQRNIILSFFFLFGHHLSVLWLVFSSFPFSSVRGPGAS